MRARGVGGCACVQELLNARAVVLMAFSCVDDNNTLDSLLHALPFIYWPLMLLSFSDIIKEALETWAGGRGRLHWQRWHEGHPSSTCVTWRPFVVSPVVTQV